MNVDCHWLFFSNDNFHGNCPAKALSPIITTDYHTFQLYMEGGGGGEEVQRKKQSSFPYPHYSFANHQNELFAVAAAMLSLFYACT